MPICELCRRTVPKVKAFVVQGMGSKDLCESCRARLAAVAPFQQPNVVREISSQAKRSITK